ncbi:unnamed protein product [Mytilus coruscus]|uniref:Uncharacterized protein n=1 Tax=Mytilus coruscus TaxID=42192 RepID=A0A6J8CQC8_MYTCO|nr:unnamed protein product [Mytilus coruscus]
MANWMDDALTLENKSKIKKKDSVYDNVRSSVSNRNKFIKSNSRKSKSRRSDIGYEEDDEDEVDSIYSDIYSDNGRSRGHVKAPRVQISDGLEPCSCFPKRSNKHISSMLYEGLECKHSGLRGEPHAGVYNFANDWRNEFEGPDPESIMPQRTNFVLGYPNPVNLDPDTDYDDEYSEPDHKDTRQSDRKTNQISKEKRESVSKQSQKSKGKPMKEKQDKETPFAGLLDFMEQDEEQNKPESRPFMKGMPITLPRIGYSPPPPPSRERLSARSVAHSLPPLPESPFLSRQKKTRTYKSNASEVDEISDENDEDNYNYDETQIRRNKRPMKGYDSSPRRFKGHYYDTATKKTRTYEITPNFRKGLGEWNAYINDRNRQNSMISGLQGRRTTNGNMYARDNNVVPEDDEYDDDDDDYEEEDKKPVPNKFLSKFKTKR